jgi:hypothetical protein
MNPRDGVALPGVRLRPRLDVGIQTIAFESASTRSQV